MGRFPGSDGDEPEWDVPPSSVTLSGSRDPSPEGPRGSEPSGSAAAVASGSEASRRESSWSDNAPRTMHDAWAWLALAALGFVGGQVVSGILLYVAAAVNGQTSRLGQLTTEAVPPAWVVIPGLVGLWVGFVTAAVIASRSRGTGSLRRDLGLEIRPRDVVVGPIVGLGGQLLLLRLLYLPLEHVVPHLNDKLSQPAKHLTGGFPGANLAVIAVLTVVVVPVVEELFFRGLILRSLVRIFHGTGRVVGPTLAVGASGILFGLAHFETLQLLGLAAFGVVLSVMAYKFRRLGPSIFAHATFNLLAVLSVAFPTGLLR